jgi:hypothetical protein
VREENGSLGEWDRGGKGEERGNAGRLEADEKEREGRKVLA